MAGPQRRPGHVAFRWLSALHGVIVMVGAIGSGVMSWIILGLLAGIAQQQAADGAEIDANAAWLLAHRGLVAAVAVPALVCGLILVLTRRFGWIWFAQGMALILILVVLVLYCFLATVGSLYQGGP